MSTRFRVTIGLTALLITTACTGAQPDEGTPSPDDTQETPVGFSNPVYEFNFPDPMIFTGSDGRYWAVATNGNTANVQTLSSTDLISWEQQDDALPELPE